MFSEPTPRQPQTPQQRRTMMLAILLMVGSIAGMLAWASYDAQHAAWLAQISGENLQFGYNIAGDLRDIHLELVSTTGAVFVYERTAAPSRAVIVAPLSEFLDAKTGAGYDPKRNTSASLRITAIRMSDGKALTATKRMSVKR